MEKLLYSFDHLNTVKKKTSGRRTLFKALAGFLLSIPLLLTFFLYQGSKLYVFMVDKSYSMTGDLDGGNSKWDALKTSISDFLEQTSDNSNYVLVSFGHGNHFELNSILENVENCGGDIVVEFTNDKNEVLDALEAITPEDTSTHLTEALYKTLNYLDNLDEIESLKFIEIVIFADGDNSYPIDEKNNVLTQDWSMLQKFRVSTVGIGAQGTAEDNMMTLALAGNGKYTNVFDTDELSRELIELSADEKNDTIYYIHLGITVVIILSMMII